jgi:alkylhydroperoxidase/carboxymuconolactone decarboxylase family protein YurZ
MRRSTFTPGSWFSWPPSWPPAASQSSASWPPQRWPTAGYLAANCFGDTVGRGGIDLEVRELLTFSMLVALGGADAQVRGHVNGNLRVGNTRARLLAVLTVLVPFIGYPRTLNGLAALNDITGS